MSELQVCNDGHDEVCFDADEGSCPACELVTDKENLETELGKLKEHVEDLEAQINELEAKLEEGEQPTG